MSAFVFNVTQTNGHYTAIAVDAPLRTEADTWDDLCRSAITVTRSHLCCADIAVILRPSTPLSH